MEWLMGMQSSNGGWAAFDRDNDMDILNRIPFADTEAMVDPPTADVTGRVLEVMGSCGYDCSHPAAKRGIGFLKNAGKGRLLVGALGRQLHLWDMVRSAGADLDWGGPEVALHQSGNALAKRPPERGWGLG